MDKTRLGGIKTLEGCSQLRARCHRDESALPTFCSRLAADRINLSSLVYTADPENEHFFLTLHTEKRSSFQAQFVLSSSYGHIDTLSLEAETDIISIFPHNQKTSVAGALVRAFSTPRVLPYALASSPSSLSVSIASRDKKRAIDALFDTFDLPTYRSPTEWHAAYVGREQVFREIVCTYEEQVIKVYDIVQQLELDLWKMVLPAAHLCHLSDALVALDGMEVRMPFLTAQSDATEGWLFALCFPHSQRKEIMGQLTGILPELDRLSLAPAAALYLHGPHFGDRYGIVSVLTGALQKDHVEPLAISCSISSISVIVRAEDIEKAMSSLRLAFHVHT